MKVNTVVKPKLDSFIGWLGGKTRLRPTIINCFPKHDCYVEVFAGSATVFFGKPPSKNEIINDFHKELVILMKVISGTYFDPEKNENPEDVRQEFIGYVRSLPAAREVFEDWKHWDENKLSKLRPAQRAFRFFYCVKKGFSCTVTGGYEASPLSSSRLNMNADFDYICKRFRDSNAQIENLDFRALVDKYNNSRANVLFFMDPPYFVANDTNYYEHVFSSKDHLDLLEMCKLIDGANNKFLITYDDLPEVIDLYKDYYIYRTDPIIYSAMQSEVERTIQKTELFISNYDVHKVLAPKAQLEKKVKGGTVHEIFGSVGESDSKIEFAEGFIGLTRI